MDRREAALPERDQVGPAQLPLRERVALEVEIPGPTAMPHEARRRAMDGSH
jgi:hypothetical protein